MDTGCRLRTDTAHSKLRSLYLWRFGIVTKKAINIWPLECDAVQCGSATDIEAADSSKALANAYQTPRRHTPDKCCPHYLDPLLVQPNSLALHAYTDLSHGCYFTALLCYRLQWDVHKSVGGWSLLSYPITGLDRPLGLQEVGAPRTSRLSALEGGKVVSPTHRPLLPPGKFPGTHFC
jgi:hypothetical protein